jgi:hypothetical protein
MRVRVRTGIGFGLLLAIGALGSAGAGHGSYFPLALAAAPLSLVPFAGFFMAPVWWGSVAALTSRSSRWPLVLLLSVHVMSVVYIVWFGTPMEPGSEQWRYLRDTFHRMPLWIGGTLALYSAGLVSAWTIALAPPSDGE